MTTPLVDIDHSRLPPGQVRVLRNLSDLFGIVEVTSKSFVIFDIDETIYQNKYSPCEMFKQQGLTLYQHAIANSPLYKHMTFQQKSKLTRILQVALQTKVPVESNTVQIIHSLQSQGVPVFALTARYPHMAAVTKKEMASLNLDLSITSPFPKDEILRDEESDAIYDHGIIFTNACEKGPVLNRFLYTLFGNRVSPVQGPRSSFGFGASSTSASASATSSAVPIPNSRGRQNRLSGFNPHHTGHSHSQHRSSLGPKTPIFSSTPPGSGSVPNGLLGLPPPALSKNKSSHSKTSSGGSSLKNDANDLMFDSDESDSEGNHAAQDDANDSSSIDGLPDKIVFVDDRFQNCVSVLAGMSFAERFRIPIQTFHYQPASVAAHAAEAEMSPQQAQDLAEFEIHHFISTGQLIDDRQARLIKAGRIAEAFANSEEQRPMDDIPTPDSTPKLKPLDPGTTPLVSAHKSGSGSMTPVTLSTPVQRPQHSPLSHSFGHTPLGESAVPDHRRQSANFQPSPARSSGPNGAPLLDLLSHAHTGTVHPGSSPNGALRFMTQTVNGATR